VSERESDSGGGCGLDNLSGSGKGIEEIGQV
jgi:hypothetical protein